MKWPSTQKHNMWFEKGLDNPVSDFADIQEFAIKSAPQGAVIVEVGSFVGESMAYMLDLVKNSGKLLKVYSVDLFDIEEMCRDGEHSLDMVMNDTGITSRKWMDAHGPRCMLSDFYKNLRHNDRDKFLTGALVVKSWDAANLFPDKSIYFCFIDAGHTYEALTKDLEAWYPKMQKDGVFAGHDWYSGEQIRRAVTDFATKNNLQIALTHSSWVLQKKS